MSDQASIYGCTTANSAHVLPPVAAPKLAPYAARVADLRATGLTAIEAMHRIERQDKHRALLPPSFDGNQGRSHKKRPMSAQRQAALDCITSEPTRVTSIVSAALGISPDSARSLLRNMADDGLVVSEKIGGRVMWSRL